MFGDLPSIDLKAYESFCIRGSVHDTDSDYFGNRRTRNYSSTQMFFIAETAVLEVSAYAFISHTRLRGRMHETWAAMFRG